MRPLVGGLAGAVRAAGAELPTNALRLLALRAAGVRVGAGARVGRGSRIARNCVIGARCRIGRRAVLDDVRLGPGCVVGDFARLSRLTAGEGTHIETHVLCIGARPRRITIGKHCYVGVGALLDHSSDLTIGDFVHVAGPSAALHTHSSVPMALKGCTLNEDRRLYGEIRIGSCTWIGGHVTIYPGRTIGDHCVVLPNSVVASDVEDRMMVGGVPAEVVRLIAPEEAGGSAEKEGAPPARTRSAPG